MDLLKLDSVMDGLEECASARLRVKWLEQQLGKVASMPLDDYLDRDETGLALAAAEIIAANRGHGSDDLEIRLPKRIDNLDALALQCGAALRRIRSQSELIETFILERDRDQFLEAMAGLQRRLQLPVVAVKRQKKAPIVSKPPGSVFQVAIPSGLYAYGRVINEHTFALYSELNDRPDCPPIGSRDYFCIATGMYEEVHAREICPVVGMDPWAAGEPHAEPKFLQGMYPFFKIRSCKEYGFIPAEVEACIGLLPQFDCDLAELVDWVMEGPDGPTAYRRLLALPNEEGVLQRVRWEDWKLEWHRRYVFDVRRNFELHRAVNLHYQKFKYEYWKSRPWNVDRPDSAGLLTFSEYFGVKK